MEREWWIEHVETRVRNGPQAVVVHVAAIINGAEDLAAAIIEVSERLGARTGDGDNAD